MMSPQIFTLKLGINRCYLIKGKHILMIDGGPPNHLKNFLKQLSALEIEPKEIRLIVLTHGDFDHIGSVKSIKELTGAKVAIHKNDRKFLEEGRFNWPPGVTRWGKVSRFVLKPFVKKITIDSLIPDIVLSGNEFPLDAFGINGKILHTPGHTWGSVSVILDTGEAFVGCMAHNGIPFCLHPRFPIYTEDPERLKESWYVLQENGAKTIYPGHGKPFSINRIVQNQIYNSNAIVYTFKN